MANTQQTQKFDSEDKINKSRGLKKADKSTKKVSKSTKVVKIEPMAFVNISIHPKPRKLVAKLRRKANQARNRLVRADINREFKGEAGSKKASEYHMKLSALSQGIHIA